MTKITGTRRDMAGQRVLMGEIDSSPQGGFWTDVGSVGPKVQRLRDRVFVGALAADVAKRSSNPGFGWIANAAAGANWAPRDSQFVVMQDTGGLAVTGMAKASLGDSVATLAPIGVAGFLLNDTTLSGRTGWALYGDVQHQPTINVNSYGLEIAAKNKGNDSSAGPYGTGFGVYGIWLSGGGDSSYGGAPTNPNNAAMVVLKNASTWNRGIVFTADALTGTDGLTGTATAIVMAKGHTVRWEMTGAVTAVRIRSDVNISGRDVLQLFDNNEVDFFGNNSKIFFRAMHTASGVNFLQTRGQIAGTAPSLEATGDDTDVDLSLIPKGAGLVKFGTHSAKAAEAFSGFITIKDSGGTSRKVMVCA